MLSHVYVVILRQGKKRQKKRNHLTTFEHQSSVSWAMSTLAKQRFSIRCVCGTIVFGKYFIVAGVKVYSLCVIFLEFTIDIFDR